MSKDKNKVTVKNLREKIAKTKSVVVADYSGLSANDFNTMRDSMKNAGAEVVVAKNTLVKIALTEEKVDAKVLDKDLTGQTAIILSYKDAISHLKTLFEFIKKVELPKIKSAIFEGKFANAEQVEMISKLPSREQLLAQAFGTMKSSINGFVRTLSGVQRKLVIALSAIAAKKQN